MEKSTKRNKNDKFSEENVKEIFHTIDKDESGEITMKVNYCNIYFESDTACQEALRACKRTNVMGKLGVEDVEEWLKLTDKDGVRFRYFLASNSQSLSGWNY